MEGKIGDSVVVWVEKKRKVWLVAGMGGEVKKMISGRKRVVVGVLDTGKMDGG